MRTFHVRYRCLHAVLRYRGVEVWLNTFLTMVLDKTQNGWLHNPATLHNTPTEKEAVTASEMI